MVSVTELWETWQEGFANKDSSRLAEFLTDDFEMTRTAGGARSRQQTLDWTAAGGNATAMDNLEVLYENDEVAVIYHSATGTLGDGVVMALYTKRGDKFSHLRFVRAVVSG